MAVCTFYPTAASALVPRPLHCCEPEVENYSNPAFWGQLVYQGKIFSPKGIKLSEMIELDHFGCK
jgi:hypothetical protein